MIFKKFRTHSVLSVAVGLSVFGCAIEPVQRETPIPVSHWGGNYTFRYTVPDQKAAVSVHATIAVVNPFYKEDESALMTPTYSKVGKGFSASMGEDMDKILIAKGMTAKGPFASRDEITYSDKKDSSLTLAPKVFISAQIKYAAPVSQSGPVGGMGSRFPAQELTTSTTEERPFEMRVGGWISFVMQEPLSDEKMWIKKLDIEEVVVKNSEYYRNGQLAFDGKPDAMADALKEIYPAIMAKFWKFIDSEEILELKKKTAEIRNLKRY